ncbi:MAG: O-antigen ligase family protein [Terriglobia bacterium]
MSERAAGKDAIAPPLAVLPAAAGQVPNAPTANRLPILFGCLEFLPRFQYSLKISVISVENILERTCGELPKPPFARWAAVLFTLFVLTLQISIAASQAFLAGAGVLYVIHLWQAPPRVRFLPIKLPLALFCVFSVVSIFWAANPQAGGFAVKKLVLFLIWLLAINLVVSARHLRRLVQGLFLVSFLASLVAIAQFVIQYRDVRAHHPRELYHTLTSTRIHGFMGHWMNFGGQQMLVFAFLLGFLLLANGRNSGTGRRSSSFEFRVAFCWWTVLALITVSIILNFTRGVWLGCFLAGIYLVARWWPKGLWALPILLALAYVGAPSLVRERLHLAMHPTQEPALSIRLEMWSVALRMIRAHPWVGVGPNNIEGVYDHYLPPGKTPEIGYHSHMHNDYLQFGAERGLPCLAAWVWLMGALGWYTWKLRRRLSTQRWIVDASLAAWVAFLAEGCFEFNFGTSPVLMAFLFVTSTPFIAGSVAASGEEMEEMGGRRDLQ